MTEQSIVLLFTLGMLCGLPAGYGLGWLLDPRNIPAMVARVLRDFRVLDRDLVAFTLMLGADGKLRGQR